MNTSLDLAFQLLFKVDVKDINYRRRLFYLANSNVPGVPCSNSALSLQHNEHPHPLGHSHGHGGPPPPFLDVRRRGWDYQHEKGTRQREWDMETGEGRDSPSRMDFDDGSAQVPPGWGNVRPEKEFPEEEYHTESRYKAPTLAPIIPFLSTDSSDISIPFPAGNIKDLGGTKVRWSTETTPLQGWKFQHLDMNQAQILVDLR